jgi:hypothetical protein
MGGCEMTTYEKLEWLRLAIELAVLLADRRRRR